MDKQVAAIIEDIKTERGEALYRFVRDCLDVTCSDVDGDGNVTLHCKGFDLELGASVAEQLDNPFVRIMIQQNIDAGKQFQVE